MKSVLSVLSGLLVIIGFVPYIRSILRKDVVRSTKPAKSTWLIWASLDTITLAGMYAKGAVNGQILGSVIGAWAVAVLALNYGTPGWTRLDKICLGGAIFGVALWQIFSSPVLGILTSLGVIFIGSIPTFVSSWKDPSHEDKLGWTIFWFACVCAVIAIPRWTLADAAQPIMFFVIESTIVCILYGKGSRSEKATV